MRRQGKSCVTAKDGNAIAPQAVEAGATRAEVLQVIALSVTSIGFGPAVAAYSWVGDELDSKDKPAD